ncbi:hypothetical protein BDA96_07G037000 [Sorghum bicolor]|uniref:Uncharacterized protein n=2 Tax=Sorghum bicolor TaxID=4558 RepID=A0A921QI95_SORBI|nr:hypothetical protein BDA96_07G037000 [Sorghum bicolor]KXG24388.1 hypothetical protein SORBI_3007G035200 [Sorghum bicolor]
MLMLNQSTLTKLLGRGRGHLYTSVVSFNLAAAAAEAANALARLQRYIYRSCAGSNQQLIPPAITLTPPSHHCPDRQVSFPISFASWWTDRLLDLFICVPRFTVDRRQYPHLFVCKVIIISAQIILV